MAQKLIIVLAGILIFFLAYYKKSSNFSVTQLFSYSIILLLNLTGSYISYSLILRQMHISSRYTDKICSLFSKGDCNNILESDAAKLWSVFGWSEIGLGFFTANILLLLFVQNTLLILNILALTNILTLPYGFWSIWYQKTKAHQWCPLCLIVQIILWSIFILNCVFGFIRVPEFDLVTIQNSMFSVSIYAVVIFSLTLIIPNLSRKKEIEQAKQEMNSIKADENVFRELLIKQPFFEVNKFDSQIYFGNPDAQLKINILTNPFCSPCARMQKRVEKLLIDIKRKICLQYVFSSFSTDLDYADKYLIAAYLEKKQSEFERIIRDWFEKGVQLKEAFFRDLRLDINEMEVEIEFNNHEEWREKSRLKATPTILVNGYKLLDNYKIEDLRYFTEFDVNIK